MSPAAQGSNHPGLVGLSSGEESLVDTPWASFYLLGLVKEKKPSSEPPEVCNSISSFVTWG